MATAKSRIEYEKSLELIRDINKLDGQRTENQALIAERQRIINELLSNSAKLTGDQEKYLKELDELCKIK